MKPTLDAFELKVENHLSYSSQGVIGFGTCLPPGALKDGAQFHFEDRANRKYPAAWRLLLRDEKEIDWAYFNFPLSLRRLEFRHFKLQEGAAPAESQLELQQDGGAIRVRNGADELVFNSDASLGLASLARDGVALLGGESFAEMEFANATYRATKPLALCVHSANEFEIVVQAQGDLQLNDAALGDCVFVRVRYIVQIGRPGFALDVLFSNRRRSDEELVLNRFALGWKLGAPVESSLVQQSSTDNLCLSRDIKIPGGVAIRDGRLVDLTPLEMPSPEELYPFFRSFDRDAFFGRVAPHLGIVLEGGGLVASWNRSRKLDVSSCSANDGNLTFEWVSPGAGGRRVPQGFSRSFRATVSSFMGDIEAEEAMKCAKIADYEPLVSVAPEWYAQNEAEEMHRVLPYRPKEFPRLEKMFWREWAKGYFDGFYNSGDWASGRGTAQMHANAMGYTWNNNEEDHIKGMAWMLMRTGDPSYGEDLRTCARHLLEVDRFAYASHPLQSGVLIAHALNHFDGAGYPSHCWAEGLLIYYKLTGDEDARDAFFQLCECLVEWGKTPEAIRFADAREMGVPITNFAHAYALTKDQKYFDAAQQFIARYRQQMDEDGGLYYFQRSDGLSWLYSEYVAVEGLWDWYELVGEEDVKKLCLEIIEWIWRYGLDAMGVYDGRATTEATLHIFFIAYTITNDETWLERGRPTLNAAISQPSGLPGLIFCNNAAYFHEAMKRGWIDDNLAPMWPPINHRAVNRTYSEPYFAWERMAIEYE